MLDTANFVRAASWFRNCNLKIVKLLPRNEEGFVFIHHRAFVLVILYLGISVTALRAESTAPVPMQSTPGSTQPNSNLGQLPFCDSNKSWPSPELPPLDTVVGLQCYAATVGPTPTGKGKLKSFPTTDYEQANRLIQIKLDIDEGAREDYAELADFCVTRAPSLDELYSLAYDAQQLMNQINGRSELKKADIAVTITSSENPSRAKIDLRNRRQKIRELYASLAKMLSPVQTAFTQIVSVNDRLRSVPLRQPSVPYDKQQEVNRQLQTMYPELLALKAKVDKGQLPLSDYMKLYDRYMTLYWQQRSFLMENEALYQELARLEVDANQAKKNVKQYCDFFGGRKELDKQIVQLKAETERLRLSMKEEAKKSMIDFQKRNEADSNHGSYAVYLGIQPFMELAFNELKSESGDRIPNANLLTRTVAGAFIGWPKHLRDYLDSFKVKSDAERKQLLARISVLEKKIAEIEAWWTQVAKHYDALLAPLERELAANPKNSRVSLKISNLKGGRFELRKRYWDLMEDTYAKLKPLRNKLSADSMRENAYVYGSTAQAMLISEFLYGYDQTLPLGAR